ncbi:hypothetical protein D9M71_289540 [compost metagenome]
MALDGKGVEGGEELVAINTLSGEEVSHLFRLGQVLALNLNGFEHRSVNLVFNTHGFEGQEHLAVGIPRATEHRRDPLEIDVLGQLLDPWIDHRLEAVAVRAAIPEQLHHFDLARYRHRNRVLQLGIPVGGYRFCRLGSHAEEAGGDQRGAENQITHALLLSSLLSRLGATGRRTGRGRPEFVSVTAAGTKKGGRSHPFHLYAAVLTQR